MSDKRKPKPRKAKPATVAVGKRKAKMCDECGKYPADFPSRTCAGCDAYKEHTA